MLSGYEGPCKPLPRLLTFQGALWEGESLAPLRCMLASLAPLVGWIGTALTGRPYPAGRALSAGPARCPASMHAPNRKRGGSPDREGA